VGSIPGFFFWRAINLVIRFEVAEILGDRCRQRRLAVVNVTNRADVYVRFVLRSNFALAMMASQDMRFAGQRAATTRIRVRGESPPRNLWQIFPESLAGCCFVGTGS
jgi:hypothetical protein